ncbi:MAG: SDR family NAD(P)-dependent oxidoreductase [Paludibacteraceae bacterium]|nr:SDR family NAD(P)-dependent oxidoreductase [Paludibacteraceae bacterium]
MTHQHFALVTGASSGIGYQYAIILAEKGYNLLIVSNEEAIYDRQNELKNRFAEKEIIALVRDLGVQSSAKELYDWCKEQDIEIEVLINNAGVYHDRDFLDDSEKFNSLILNLHMYTPAMLLYYFGQDMTERGKGYILNMSSVTSNFGAQRLATYSSTKGFLRFFSRATHVELRAKGVSVTCVRPGAVATGLYNISPAKIKAGLFFGYIITPEKLAKKGINAMLKRKAEITPGLSTKILDIVVSHLPIWLLRLIRKLRIF